MRARARQHYGPTGKPKTMFIDEGSAMQALVWMTSRNRDKFAEQMKALRIYICQICGYMHIGHLSKKRRQQ